MTLRNGHHLTFGEHGILHDLICCNVGERRGCDTIKPILRLKDEIAPEIKRVFPFAI